MEQGSSAAYCRRVVFTITAGIGILASGSAWAGGMWLYESGQIDVATASAGRAATADDASTAFGNPAGMTRLEGSNVLFGLQPIIVTTEFDIGRNTTTSGTNGGNAGGFVPSGGVYGVYSINHDLKLGASFNSYAGGSLEYEDDWVGRYFATEATLLTFNFNPVIAYRVLPWLSVGAGFSVQWAKAQQEVAIFQGPSSTDGQMKFEDTNFGFGGNFGLLAEIDDETRVGIAYRSQVDQSFDDVPSFARLNNGFRASSALGVDMTIPQEVVVSGYRDLTDDLAIMANFNWQNWNQFGQFGVSLASAPPRSVAVDSNLKDTFQGALGAHYRLGKPTMLLLGFAYDSSAADESTRSVSLPMDRQVRLAVGVQYAVTSDYTIGFGYEYANLGSAAIDKTRTLSGTVQGDYGMNTLNVINLTVAHRF